MRKAMESLNINGDVLPSVAHMLDQLGAKITRD